MKIRKFKKTAIVALLAITIVLSAFIVVACSEHTHTYGAWTVVTEATCNNTGVEERVCSGCSADTEGHKETRTTRALGHSYGTWQTVQDATCEVDGTKERICKRSNCSDTDEGHRQQESIAKKGHLYDTDTQNPTFNTDGKTITTCTRNGCQYHSEQPITKLGIPQSFQGVWECPSLSGNDITITANSVAIEHVDITSWDGQDKAIIVVANVVGGTERIGLALSDNGLRITMTYASEPDTNYVFVKQGTLRTITVTNDDEKGSYSFDIQAPYTKGDVVKLTVLPITGNKIKTVKLNDSPISGTNGIYTISIADENLTIEITYEEHIVVEGAIDDRYVGTWEGTGTIDGNSLSLSMTVSYSESTNVTTIFVSHQIFNGGYYEMADGYAKNMAAIAGGYSFDIVYGEDLEGNDYSEEATIMLSLDNPLELTFASTINSATFSITLTKKVFANFTEEYYGTWSGTDDNLKNPITVVIDQSSFTLNDVVATSIEIITSSYGTSAYLVVCDGKEYEVMYSSGGAKGILIIMERTGVGDDGYPTYGSMWTL